MPLPPDRTARRVAGALLVLAALWATAIAVTPWVARRAPRRSPSLMAVAGVYQLGALVCHQRPDRSFRAGGVQWPVCARCAGLYGSAGLAAWFFIVAPRRPSRSESVGGVRAAQLLAVAGGPTAITWLAERTGLWSPGNVTRAVLAVPLGVAVCWMLAGARRAAGDPAAPEVN